MEGMLPNRMTTLITAAVFFLAIGTFISVTVQGAYQVLIAVPMAYYAWSAKGRHFRLPASAWWLLAFAAVAVLSVLINWDLVPRPSKNLGRAKYFVMAAFGIFPFGVWLATVSDRTKRRLVRSLAVACAVAGFWCGWQVLVTGLWKAQPLTETMRYCYGSALVLVLWVGLLLHRKRFAWLPVSWSILGIVGALSGIIFTQARGAQGAFLLAMPFVLVFWKRKLGLAALLAGALGGSFLAWNYLYGTNTDHPLKILRSSGNSSDQLRRSQWQAAYIAWKEKPVLGWGHTNFHSQLKRIKHQYDLPGKDYNDAHAHNVPLEIAAGTGIIGLFFFLGWFFTWMWECWKAGGMVRALMMPFFVAVAFEAQFEVILDANNATWITFLYAVSLAVDRRFQLPFSRINS